LQLQKQISNEFNFINEAKNMEIARKGLERSVPEVIIPRPIFSTRRALVMTFIEGDNICKLAEFRNRKCHTLMTPWLQKKFGTKLLSTLAKAWGEQIFELRVFNADPHPGNICIDKRTRAVGLLDWGQVKTVSDKLAVDFSRLITAMNSREQKRIVDAFVNLGVETSNPEDYDSVEGIAVTMLDTRNVPGFVIDPFNPMNALKKNSVKKMPSDLYFVVRTVQLLRGIAFAFGLDYSLAKAWAPYAERTLAKYGAANPAAASVLLKVAEPVSSRITVLASAPGSASASAASTSAPERYLDDAKRKTSHNSNSKAK
jgi:predicted unusual protein kinase regulating ubiquinone biosynthesis (AarF/ABC1/UbiB family)